MEWNLLYILIPTPLNKSCHLPTQKYLESECHEFKEELWYVFVTPFCAMKKKQVCPLIIRTNCWLLLTNVLVNSALWMIAQKHMEKLNSLWAQDVDFEYFCSSTSKKTQSCCKTKSTVRKPNYIYNHLTLHGVRPVWFITGVNNKNNISAVSIKLQWN